MTQALEWFHGGDDDRTRIHVLRLLAASRDPRAALVLGAASESKSLDVRVAASAAFSKARRGHTSALFGHLLEGGLKGRLSQPLNFGVGFSRSFTHGLRMQPPLFVTTSLLPWPKRSAAFRMSICLAAMLSLGGNQLTAQVASFADRSRERYQSRISTAEKVKAEMVAKAGVTYEAEAKLAKEEVRKTFEPLIRAAAMRSQTDEVRKLTFQMENIINPDGAVPEGIETGAAAGSDYKLLVGTWVSNDMRKMEFEFKGSRAVFYTYTYTNTNGGGGTQTRELKASIKPDKIIIDEKEVRGFSSSHKQWYEIALPFNPEALQIVNYHEGPQSKGNNTINLVRRKD